MSPMTLHSTSRFPRRITLVAVTLLLAGMADVRRLEAHTAHPNPGGGTAGLPENATTTLISPLLTPFVDALPIPGRATPARTTNGYCVPVLPDLCFSGPLEVYDMPMLRITNHQFHSSLPPMEVWGYAGQYPGPTIEAKVGEPLLVNWINSLTNNEGKYPYWLRADTNLFHGGAASGVSGQAIRTVVHLHGAAVLPRYDGYPTNWFLPGESDQYFYGNVDFNADGQTLWYHDHAIGVTANNVYAGLAGFYLVRAEGYDERMGIRLPSGPHEIPLVFQDRDFAVTTWSENGVIRSETNLYNAGLPWHHYAVVNGKVTPYLEVEPRPYRFRILNGTNFRALALRMAMTQVDGSAFPTNVVPPSAPTFQVIGNEDGYLRSPATHVQRIATMPGERVDVVVDFSSFAGSLYTNITIQNAFGAGGNNADVVGAPFITNLMQFRVSLPLSTNGTPVVTIPQVLATNWVTTESLVSLAMTNRPVTLDLLDPTGTVPFQGPPFNLATPAYPFALINMRGFHEPITEFPQAGDIEVWEIVNLSKEAHPFHVHLLDFRVVNRQRFASDRTTLTTPWGGDPNVPPVMVGKYIIDRLAGTLQPLTAYLSINPNDLIPPQPFETGPKDVVRAAPFAVTRIVMQWPTNAMFYNTPSARSGDPSTHGRFIYHCHILDHEDNDMMRPLQLRPPWQPTLGLFNLGTPTTNAFNAFVLGYPYRLNQQYTLETTASLGTPQWTSVAGPRPTLDIPRSLWLLEPPDSQDPSRFYRILPVLPVPPVIP